ncbi:pilus assembly PilX family protein [Halomonas getboli]|uniref:pilus assembly PilX family protein n=1 Tax=Halomonas getboli TaxID=2935862 RepID=UPI00200036DF|nr:PilX N-terminal domain-containing pilus assembly protein [Halomonas getboli]MCK2183814.1 PilX N-terminal domain-containing pilus assembly protein [Halomonas getboli]
MALVVVLVLVAMGTILAVSTFQSSLLQERITGNQRMATQARMGAEAGVSAGRRAYKEDDDSASDDTLTWSALTETSSFSRYQYAIVDEVQAEEQTGLASLAAGTYVLSRGYAGPEDSPIERMILSQVASDVTVPDLEAVFTCFGDDCSASGVDHIDGEDHPLPSDFGCSGSGCTTTPEDDADAIAQTKLYNDDWFTDETAKSDGATVSADYEETRQAWEDYVDSLTPSIIYSSKNDKIASTPSRTAPQVIAVTGTAKMNSKASTSGVIIVESGGSLKLNGTAHHEGLIIVKPGGQILKANGTFDLYGGLVMLKSTDPDGLGSGDNGDTDLPLSGSINLSYSQAALDNLGLIAGSGGGATAASWQEIY